MVDRAVPWLPLALALLVGAARAEPPAGRLRVVTFNVAGLPWGLAPRRQARIARIGPALAALEPDVVALQEVWVEDDGATLARALADAGLVHARHVSEGLLGSGLLVASRFPLTVEGFTPFEAIGKLHVPWHGDAYARKGVVVVRLETPLGPVRLANTHLHARYGSEVYAPIQVAQALQVVEAAGDFGARPPPRTADPARPPLVVAGDLNTTRGQLAFELLLGGAALRPVAAELGIDWILVRDGGALGVRARRTREVLGEPVDLGDGGEPAPLSDHRGVLCELELRPGPAGTRAGPRARPWPGVREEAVALLARASAASEADGARSRRRALIALLAAGLCFAAARQRRGKRAGCALAGLTLALLHAGVWLVYLGTIHAPLWTGALDAARERLAP